MIGYREALDWLRRRRPERWRRWATTLAGLAAVWAGSWYGGNRVAVPELAAELAAPTGAERVAVTVAKVRRGPLREIVTYPAQVTADEEVAVDPRVAGWVTRIAVDEGSLVREGEIVAELDREELEAELGEKRARLVFAKAELGRVSRLADKKALAAADRDKARLEYEKLEAEVARLETLVDYTRIRAPLTGVVLRRHVDEGVLVRPGAPIVTVADLSHVRVQCQIGERDQVRVRPGTRCTLRFPDLSARNVPAVAARRAASDGMNVAVEQFAAREIAVTAAFPAVTGPGRTGIIEIRFPNVRHPARRGGEAYLLRPGMVGALDIVLREEPEALLIPRRALLTAPQGTTKVFTIMEVEGSSLAFARDVRVRGGHGDWVEVLEGLSEGETVAVSGAPGLEDGQEVHVVREETT